MTSEPYLGVRVCGGPSTPSSHGPADPDGKPCPHCGHPAEEHSASQGCLADVDDDDEGCLCMRLAAQIVGADS